MSATSTLLRLLLVSGLLVVISVSFRGTRARPSTLQSLASMQGSFQVITHESSLLAVDVHALQQSLYRQNSASVQRASVVMKRDARILCRHTGQSGYALRRLLRDKNSFVVSAYLRMALATMTFQWDEGATLQRVADLTWHDPYVWLGNDAQRLRSWQITAQWYAWRAVESANAANRFRFRHRRAFRYVRISSMR